LAHINHEIRTGDFFKNEALVSAVKHAKDQNSSLHLMGCTSPGGIHAHTDHLIALLQLAGQHKLERVFVHFISDGQDMPAQDALNVMEMLEPHLEKAGAKIASISGRSYAMDRVLNWKLTEQVWHAVVRGDAPQVTDPAQYLRDSYTKDLNDYDIEPATVSENGQPVGPVGDSDAIIFFDYRNDRVRQLATPFIVTEGFEEFDRGQVPQNLKVVTMTKYSQELTAPIAYQALELPETLGEMVSRMGWRQYRIAEKEKEAHVTNFLNGGRITPFQGEERIIVSSRAMKGKEYLEHPEMSAQKVVDAVLEKKDDGASLYVINFANPDMIAHTGNLEASVKACQVTDDAVKQIVEIVRDDEHSIVIITADHGNAEELYDPATGREGDTQHSARNVPVVIIAPQYRGKGTDGTSLEMLAQQAPAGTLVDVAPTVLTMLGITKPEQMSGSSLL
jgi:2,3-bisphosphoglycerate-independent phosphoglycerate mutase